MKDIEIFIDAHVRVMGGLNPPQVTYGWSASWYEGKEQYIEEYRGGYSSGDEALESAKKTLTHIAERKRIEDDLLLGYPKTIRAKDLSEL